MEMANIVCKVWSFEHDLRDIYRVSWVCVDVFIEVRLSDLVDELGCTRQIEERLLGVSGLS